MKKIITNLSVSKAALVVGIAFISSVIIVTIVDDFLLANFVVPGDPQVLIQDIDQNRTVFHFAVLGYLVVLMLDAIIGIALYIVLKPANKKLAWLTATLRLLYAFTLVVALIALVFQSIDVYRYASLKLIGYIFFALHIFILGYSIIKSGYISKSLGILLIVASFTYTVFFVDFRLPESLQLIVMVTMLMAELSLSIWLIVKRNTLI
ncbi:hypothetical protein KORDIASMS9_03382 [Kordia sp. SMS9]|uniref:DUF4386 domain-containing protein n=1 Tax=Kordia sp. SMS9 TaxID=2282170 RepID=UPI000E0DAFA6|nr:DUF4386 domain-containing protein [Kordia sp. SMS9]AXG71127.1 hypothetical protein KORDIASMS9_03382 [Kordia sp. SMS9]